MRTAPSDHGAHDIGNGDLAAVTELTHPGRFHDRVAEKLAGDDAWE